MNKFKMFSLATVALLLVMVLSACGGGSSDSSGSANGQTSGSKEKVYEFYDKVQMDQTQAEVDAELGVAPQENTQLKNSYTYTNEDTGFGVSVLFSENGVVTSKTLFYPNAEDIAFLTPKAVTQEQADKIPDGSTYDEVKTLLGGEGIETSATQIPFEDNQVSYIRVWVNQDGSMLQAVFLTDGTTNNVMFFD